MKEMLTNRILSDLPDAEFARLMPLLEPVSLSAGGRINGAGDKARFVYFPESAVLSCHAEMQDGKSTEIALIGRDGVTGLASLLGGSRPSPHTLGVTVAGSALRVRKDDFERELRAGEGLLRALLSYVGDYVTQVSQRAACAVLHRMEQRLAVWLLLLTDRLESGAVELTQERIANHLGVRRAGVTEVAGELQRRGVISYTRGSLRVVNREALEEVACECYAAMAGARRQRQSTYH
ncbi:MAG TPA: Crp/Fnr family transcriptional regulator [Pyrinomonadaceae bacterium]|nr:Crp/Fnr family transcriptional regulator [Pyrinomonadaceae bacterium]